MALTAYSGSLPQRNDRATFSTRADSWVTWFTDTIVGEIDAAIIAFNLNDTTDTSTTSNSVDGGTDAKTFTVSSGKSFVKGMFLLIADSAAPATNYMIVQVTSYSGTTLNVTRKNYSGSGTKTSWQISFASATDGTLGRHEVWVRTGNGYGATNIMIPRFTTTTTNTGSDITYADSAANGASFTINADGIYAITYVQRNSAANTFGVSLNSSELTTSIIGITASDILTICSASSGNGESAAVILELANADVVRPHTNGVGTNLAEASFRIIKLHGF